MATSGPINYNDLGKGPMIMGVTWMMTSISVIVVALRFYVRSRLPSRLGLEDWLMAVAVVGWNRLASYRPDELT